MVISLCSRSYTCIYNNFFQNIDYSLTRAIHFKLDDLLLNHDEHSSSYGISSIVGELRTSVLFIYSSALLSSENMESQYSTWK